MPDLASANGVPIAEPPSKRRRVRDGAVSAPRYSSPVVDSPQARSLSIRRGRPPGRSPPSRDASRSRSGSHSGSGSGSGNGSGSENRSVALNKRYHSASTSSRSRSRSRSRTRSQSGRSRSRTRPRSYSRSPSRSLSRSRSRTRSPSDSRSRSRARSSASPSRSRSSSLGAQRRLSPSTSQPPADSPPSRREPVRPRFRRRLMMRGHAAPVSQVRISPDGRWIASASADRTAKLWDAATGAHLDTLVGHMAGVSCLAWAPDSNTLATGSDDKAIRLWDRVTGNPAHASGSGSGGGGKIGGGGGGGGGVAAQTRGGRSGRRPLLGHHHCVHCIAFSPKGNILASGSYDEAVFLWDVRAGRQMRSLPAHSDPVMGIGFCRDGTLVVSCSTDGLIRIWDTSTGQCLRTLVHEDNPAVTNVCFSPNGRFVLAFSLDSCIRLWDYVSGTVKKTYEGHKNAGFCIGGCFGVLADGAEENGNDDDDKEGSGGGGGGGSGNGSRARQQAFVASASEDGDIVLWDVRTKEVVQRIERAHQGVCFWVDVHGDTMVSAGQDGRVCVYSNRNRNTGRAAAQKGEQGRRGVEADDRKAAVNGNGNGNVNGVNGDGPKGHSSTQSPTAEEALQRQFEADAAASIKREEEVEP